MTAHLEAGPQAHSLPLPLSELRAELTPSWPGAVGVGTVGLGPAQPSPARGLSLEVNRQSALWGQGSGRKVTGQSPGQCGGTGARGAGL